MFAFSNLFCRLWVFLAKQEINSANIFRTNRRGQSVSMCATPTRKWASNALKYLWLTLHATTTTTTTTTHQQHWPKNIPSCYLFLPQRQALHLKRGVCVILIILQRLTPPANAKWILWLDSIWADSCAVVRGQTERERERERQADYGARALYLAMKYMHD